MGGVGGRLRKRVKVLAKQQKKKRVEIQKGQRVREEGGIFRER